MESCFCQLVGGVSKRRSRKIYTTMVIKSVRAEVLEREREGNAFMLSHTIYFERHTSRKSINTHNLPPSLVSSHFTVLLSQYQVSTCQPLTPQLETDISLIAHLFILSYLMMLSLHQREQHGPSRAAPSPLRSSR